MTGSAPLDEDFPSAETVWPEGYTGTPAMTEHVQYGWRPGALPAALGVARTARRPYFTSIFPSLISSDSPPLSVTSPCWEVTTQGPEPWMV